MMRSCCGIEFLKFEFLESVVCVMWLLVFVGVSFFCCCCAPVVTSSRLGDVVGWWWCVCDTKTSCVWCVYEYVNILYIYISVPRTVGRSWVHVVLSLLLCHLQPAVGLLLFFGSLL